MIDALTEDERAEVRADLQRARAAESELLAVESVSPAASVRRTETLARMRGEITRMERLLSSAGASTTSPGAFAPQTDPGETEITIKEDHNA